MRNRRCSHQARQMQIVRVLDGQWGLTVKQIARRLKVSERSVRRYLPVLLLHRVVVINFKQNSVRSKKPIHYYALKGL